MITVQFRIDRSASGEIRDTLPVAVWVEFPAVPVIDYTCAGGCEKVYYVVPESIPDACETGLRIDPPKTLLKFNRVGVCPCMGEIIE